MTTAIVYVFIAFMLNDLAWPYLVEHMSLGQVFWLLFLMSGAVAWDVSVSCSTSGDWRDFP